MMSALRRSLSLTLGTLVAGLLACDTGAAGENAKTVTTPPVASASVHKTAGDRAPDKSPPSLATPAVAEAGAAGSDAKADSATPEIGAGLGAEAASDRDIDGQMGALRATLAAYSSCSTTCLSREHAAPTDLESCALRCRNRAESSGVTPKSKAHDLVVELDVCTSRCDGKDVEKETNRETCYLNCDNAFKAQADLLKVGDNVVDE